MIPVYNYLGIFLWQVHGLEFTSLPGLKAWSERDILTRLKDSRGTGLDNVVGSGGNGTGRRLFNSAAGTNGLIVQSNVARRDRHSDTIRGGPAGACCRNGIGCSCCWRDSD